MAEKTLTETVLPDHWTHYSQADFDINDHTTVIDTREATRLIAYSAGDALEIQANTDPTASGPGSTFVTLADTSGAGGGATVEGLVFLGDEDEGWSMLQTSCIPPYTRFYAGDDAANNSRIDILIRRRP